MAGDDDDDHQSLNKSNDDHDHNIEDDTKPSPTEATTDTSTSRSRSSSDDNDDVHGNEGGDHVVANKSALEVVEGESRQLKSTSSSTSSLSSLKKPNASFQQQQQQQQTRFSFYDAREVSLQYTSSIPSLSDDDNKKKVSINDDDTDKNKQQKTGNRFHFYDPSIMPVSATTPSSDFIDRDRNRMGDTIKNGGTGSDVNGNLNVTSSINSNNNRERLTASGRKQPKTLSVAEPSHADEILRSLQETEVQRLNILKNRTSGTRIGGSHQITTSSTSTATITAATPNGGCNDDAAGAGGGLSTRMNATNPYEDAIKEALVLLRKHRSPPGSPSHHPERNYPNNIDLDRNHIVASNISTVHDSLDESSNGQTPRTVKTGRSRGCVGPSIHVDSVEEILDPQQEQHIPSGSNTLTGGIGNLSDNITGALQEAKLKAKKRQERMAEYASRLQEFKSSLPPEQQLQLQPSSSFQSQNDDDGAAAPLVPAPTPTTQPISVQEWVPSDERRKEYRHQEDEEVRDSVGEQPLFIQHAASTDSAGILSELSHSTKPVPSHQMNSSQSVGSYSQYGPTDEDRQRTVEEEVQKGVEKVLLAILEASRTKGEAAATDNGGNILSNDIVQRIDASTISNPGHGGQVSETLLRVMDEVLYKNSAGANWSSCTTGGDHGTNRIVRSDLVDSSSVSKVSLGGKSQASHRSKQSGGEHSSVVDELLAEEDEPNGNEQKFLVQQRTRHPLSTNSNYWTEEKKFTDELTTSEKPKEPSTMVKSTVLNDVSLRYEHEVGIDNEHEVGIDNEMLSEEYGGGIYSTGNDEDEDDDLVSENEDDEHDDNHDQRHCAVLGPLSRKAGGTTGIVLDSGETAKEDLSRSNGYFSSVVDYVSSALTPEEKQSMENDAKESVNEMPNQTMDSRKDSYPPGVDSDSMDLMRTLCAHLLPFGVDRHSDFRESLPEWDESNENEAGYRIIRLSRSQLRLVERAFEVMVAGLKNKSQSQLNGLEGEYDANFIRELQEAERLLDDEERRLDAKLSETAPLVTPSIFQGVSTSSEAAGAKIGIGADDSVESDEGHPDFPGVKSTGRGEMGDLEYFHLPIIFKSHVTGFEPTKDMVLEPGNVVAGQYLVESELGSAAFSTAYRCIDLSSDNQEGQEEVCLKVIKNTKDFFDQSLDEIKILELLRQTGKCDDNFIVRMKTFFYYREHLIIVTELLRQNLFEFGKFIVDNDEEPYFTIPRLAYITRQCLIALRFVHGLGLVHSDVKPENILLGSYSRAKIKLIDFGSSCYLTDRQSSYIQSRSYRAPEVVLGLPYDGRIDVWSLGCVVAEMYTGEVTFQNDSIVSMLSRIEAIRGSFPRHMIAQGRQSGRFFTKSGLLYEVVDESDHETRKNPPGPNDSCDESDSDSDTSVLFDIFQPKNTTLASRLGFEADLMDDYDPRRIPPGQRDLTDFELEQVFADFVGRLLTIDPDGRPSADEALRHPYMVYASTLTEEMIKYPSN